MTDAGQAERESPHKLEEPQKTPLAVPHRHRRRWLALAACALIGLVVVAGWWWSPFGLFGDARRDARSTTLPTLDPESQSLRDEVFEAAESLVEKYPRDPDALYSKAGIHNRFGDSEVAVDCWRRCLEIDPEFALPYYCLGWDALDRGECEESVDFLRKALALDEKMGHAYLLLARAMMDLGRMDEAMGPLETHLRLAPRSTEGYFQLGQCHLHAKQYQTAKRYYLAVLDIDPNSDLAYNGLAKASEGLGEAQQAEEYRKKFAELKAKGLERSRERKVRERDGQEELLDGVAFAHTDIAKVYSAHGELPEAEKHCRRAAKLAPRDTESRKLLVSIYRKSQRLGEAVQCLQELGTIEPSNAIHQINIGVLSNGLGRFEAANEAFCKVREMIPHRHEGYAGLAQLYLEANRNTSEAEDLAKKAVELAPIAANYHLLGLVQAKFGDREEALQSLKRATELDRGNRLYDEVYTTLNQSQ